VGIAVMKGRRALVPGEETTVDGGMQMNVDI